MLKQQPSETKPLSIATQITDRQADTWKSASSLSANLTQQNCHIGASLYKGTPFGHHEAVKEMIKKERKKGL